MNTHAEMLYFAAVRSDFTTFVQHSFASLYPERTFMGNWHIDAIAHFLTEAIEGRKPRVIINLPPRQLKSFLVSVVFPAFILGMDPTAKIICCSYSEELAKVLARDFRRIVESDWYQQLFPEVRAVKVTETDFVTDAGGSRYAVSVGGTLTGRGGDFIIVDDPIKPEDACSEQLRKSTNEWFRSTLLSRLDDKARSVMILVMQRLHINDLTGFLEAGGGFSKLSLSAIAECDEQVPIEAGRFYDRYAGTALHEEREGLSILARIRDQIGSANFAAQYQQQPEMPDGSIFRRKWFQLIDTPPSWQSGGQLYVSVDSALSTSETADYSAISEVYADRTGYYVLHSERGHWDYEDLKTKLLGYYTKHGERLGFIIEPAGVGISLISLFRKMGIPCLSSSLKNNKLTRAAYAVPAFQEGRVHVVDTGKNNAWVEPYLAEFMSFPNGRFDDQVDSLVQLINYLDKRLTANGYLLCV